MTRKGNNNNWKSEIELYKKQITKSEELKRPKLVDFVTFVEDKEYMDHPPMSDLMYDEYYKWLEDGYKLYSFRRKIFEYCGLYGKGSGKTTFGELVENYAIYVLLNYDDPHKYFGIARKDTLEFVDVACGSLKQAKQEYFDEFSRLVENSLWFKHNYTMISSGKEISVPVHPKGEIIFTGSSIQFPNNILAVPLPSKAETFEGGTVVFYIMDESSGFKSERGQHNAEILYNSLMSSTRELPYIGFIFSYPRLDKENDWTFKKLIESGNMGGNKKIRIGAQYTLFQAKPERFFYTDKKQKIIEWVDIVIDKNTGETVKIPNIPKYVNLAETNPDEFKAKILAIPTGIGEKYLDYYDFDRIVACGESLLKIETVINKIRDKRFVANKIVQMNPVRFPLVITLDQGETGSDTALTIGYQDVDKIRCCQIILWRPDKEKRIVIDEDNVVELVLELCKNYNVQVVRMDYWNASVIAQKLYKLGIKVVKKAATPESYSKMRSALYRDCLVLPEQSKEVEEFKNQLRALRPSTGASKPKVEYGKQDLLDAMAELTDELWIEEFSKGVARPVVGTRPMSVEQVKEIVEKESFESILDLKRTVHKISKPGKGVGGSSSRKKRTKGVPTVVWKQD